MKIEENGNLRRRPWSINEVRKSVYNSGVGPEVVGIKK